MDRKEEDANYNNYIEEEIERIKSENPGIYFKREDLLQLMRIPRWSKSLIIIRCNYKGTGFRRDGYVAEYLKDKISEDEFKKVIDNASYIMKKLYSK